jgi:hypothetical protein
MVVRILAAAIARPISPGRDSPAFARELTTRADSPAAQTTSKESTGKTCRSIHALAGSLSVDHIIQGHSSRVGAITNESHRCEPTDDCAARQSYADRNAAYHGSGSAGHKAPCSGPRVSSSRVEQVDRVIPNVGVQIGVPPSNKIGSLAVHLPVSES